jgi:hypothetical protein
MLTQYFLWVSGLSLFCCYFLFQFCVWIVANPRTVLLFPEQCYFIPSKHTSDLIPKNVFFCEYVLLLKYSTNYLHFFTFTSHYNTSAINSGQKPYFIGPRGLLMRGAIKSLENRY